MLAAARELDYRPSGVARSLKRQTTETLGLIVTDIENPYFPELVRAVEDAARAEGYAILLCNAADDPEREAGYLDLLVERRVDGLIIAASSLGGRHAEWLAAAPLPVVLVNTTAADVDLPSIHSDNRAGSRLAAQHLLDLGHRRFGYLMPPPRNVDGPVRLAGRPRRARRRGARPGVDRDRGRGAAGRRRRGGDARAARPGARRDRRPRLQRPDGDRGAARGATAWRLGARRT